MLPVVAAVAGWRSRPGLPGGFRRTSRRRAGAVPVATDIAFALAVLAVLTSLLSLTTLRAFLLTLAVADDLGAILVMAAFFAAAPSSSVAGRRGQR